MADNDELKDVEDLFNADDPEDMEELMNMLESIDIDNHPLIKEMEDSDTDDLEEELGHSSDEEEWQEADKDADDLSENEKELEEWRAERQEESIKLSEMMSELGLGDISQLADEAEEAAKAAEVARKAEESAFVDSGNSAGGSEEEMLIELDAEGLATESVGELADILAGIPEKNLYAKSERTGPPPKRGFFQRLLAVFHREPSEEEKLQRALDEEEVRAWEERRSEIAQAKKTETEQKKNVKKAEAEKKKKEQADKKAAAKAAKEKKTQVKKKEQAAKKAAKREAKLAAKGGPVPKSQLVPVKPMLVFVILGVACCVLFVLYTNYRFYNTSVADSKEKFIHQQYKEAYETLVGLEIKEKDKKFYDQVRTVRIVGKDLDAYKNYIAAEEYEMALKSLIKGMGKYNEQAEKAKELNLEKEMYSIYEEMLKELTVRFGMTAQEAMDLYKSTDKEAFDRQVLKAALDAAIRDGVEEPVNITRTE